ncbi:MAG: hypothetical protein AB7U97_27730, partial [Pirellulales bacterium]
VTFTSRKRRTNRYSYVEGALELTFQFFFEKCFQANDVVPFLRLHLLPKLSEVRSPIGIGDVLVVAPKTIEAPAQFMNQIVIVVSASTAFSKVFQFTFGGE